MTADLRTSLHAIAVERDIVRVAGPDAITYLQGQLSQDVADLAPGEVGWTFVLQPTGKVDAWVRVVRTADDEVVLDVDGGYGEAVIARLRRFLLRTKADVDPLDWRVVALRGPGAEAAARDAATADLRVPAGWPGVEGVDLVGPEVELPARGPRGHRRRLRGAAHPQRHAGDGRRADRRHDPRRGRPVGHRRLRELHQGLLHRPGAGGPHRQPRGQRPPPPAGPRPRRRAAPPEPGTTVVVDGAEVGTVTSSAPAPGGGAVALAFVRRAVDPPAEADGRRANPPRSSTCPSPG